MSDTIRERHRGVIMSGSDGIDGPKAFYIEIEAPRMEPFSSIAEGYL